MRRIGLTSLFSEQLGLVARRQPDPAGFQELILEAARIVAAGRAPRWMAFHALHGMYDGYWSFKPFPFARNFMVICVPRDRVLLLGDLGPHERFFTRGRKTQPPSPGSLKES